MFELFIPYVIGLALGADPAPVSAPQVAADAAPQIAADAAPIAATDAAREPEPQIATGKYTTAVEVRPILGMTKSNWVAVRLYDGQDLVYFTHLMSWRCGLWDVRYGLNGAPATQVVALEPCNTDHATPNAMIDMDNFPPYISLPGNSVDSIYVEITYDDGTTDFARFDRGQVLIP